MLTGKQITLKNGTTGTIVSVDCERITLNVNGVEKLYGTEVVINNGLIVNPDHDVVEEIKDIIKEAQVKKAAAATANKVFTSPTQTSTVRVKSTAATIGTTSILQYLNKYGTVARDIYDQCVSVFGFDGSQAGKFGKQQELYAMNATKEGYSVWFLAHSNWTGDKNGKWRNYIGDKTIDEFWDDATITRFDTDSDKRVVFAKDGNAEYVFLGVYKCTGIDQKKSVKHYERIQDFYK